MSFRREEGTHAEGRRRASGDSPRATVERNRRSPRLLLLLSGLLVAVLLVAVIFLWRSLGDNLSGTSVERDTMDAGSNPHLRLTNGPGKVRIEGLRELESVEYEVTKHAVGSDPASAKRKASEVPVDVSREGSEFAFETDGGRRSGADYALEIPAGGSVEVRSSAGDVEVTGLSGNVTVRADAGDVTVRDVGGSVSVEAPQGDVVVSGVNTDAGQAEIAVGSGDVTLDDVVVGTLEARVESGDVTLSGRFSGGGRVFVQTGDILVKIPPEDTRDLTLEAVIGEVMREAPSEDGGRPERPAGS